MATRLDEQTQDEQTVERVRGWLVDQFERATVVTEYPMNAWRLLRCLVDERNRLAHARELISGQDHYEQVVREAELASLREPERLQHTTGRLDFAKAWLELLVEASERVEREAKWGRRYAAAREDEEQGLSHVAGARWRDL